MRTSFDLKRVHKILASTVSKAALKSNRTRMLVHICQNVIHCEPSPKLFPYYEVSCMQIEHWIQIILSQVRLDLIRNKTFRELGNMG